MIRLHASALPRIMACAGSTQFPALPPEQSSESAREGTAAHWVAEQFIRDGGANLPDVAPNGIPIDADMTEHARNYAGLIPSDAMVECNGDWYASRDIEIACKVDAAWFEEQELAPGVTLQTLYVLDFKYGWRIVDPDYNTQLIAYAVGVIRRLAADGVAVRPDLRLALGIYQPRPYHPDGAHRVWRLTLDELIGHHDVIVQTLEQLPSDALVTGEHCEYCPGAATGACAAYLRATTNAIDVAMRRSPVELTTAAMARELIDLQRAQAMLKDRLEFAQDNAKRALAANPAALPGWILKPQYANTSYTKDGAEAIKRETNLNVYAEPKLATPAELKRRGVPDDVIAKHTHRPLIGQKLERHDPDAEVRKALKAPRKPRKSTAKAALTPDAPTD